MTSPDVQRHAIQTYADAHNVTIAGWVEGVDESGSRSRSAWWPKLNAAIDRVESGDADLILVWKFSRTARNRLKWAVAIDRMDTLGGDIISVTEPIESDTASGRFARGMLGEMNAYQADLISEGWKETQARRIREGKPATGRARFGYMRDREADTYLPHPDQADAVRELYARYIAGEGIVALTTWLNGQGHRTSRGGRWQPSTLKSHLDHGFAAGLLYVHGSFLPGAHAPLISEETWDAYRAKRESATVSPRGTLRMASGLVRCGCGGPMMIVSSTAGRGSYACARTRRGMDPCEYRFTIQSQVVERRVGEWIADLPARVDLLREAELAASSKRARNIEDRSVLARRIARTESRLADLVVRLVEEKISQAAYDLGSSKLEADLVELTARHRAAAPTPAARTFDHIPEMARGFPHLSPPAQNRVARSLIRRVEISAATRAGSDPLGRVRVVPMWEHDD